MRATVVAGLMWGCASPAEPVTPEVQRLTRASLDLRGVRPSEGELASVQADPSTLEAWIEHFVMDPRLEARATEMFSEALRTRSENYPLRDPVRPGEDALPLELAIGDEPLRLMGRVAVLDAPWTEVLTADWTMVDEHLAAVYPTDHTGTGWSRAHYVDGRPAAGVLATNGLYWRFRSTPSNMMRKPANQISRMFICEDFLEREVGFDDQVDLLDEEEVANAIATNPGCTACHDTLDPIASYLWGHHFDLGDTFAALDGAIYHPDRERWWREATGRPPGWFGQEGESLADLAMQIAADPRFVSCTVERVATALLRGADAPDLPRHEQAFVAGGLRFRALVRSVLTDPAYHRTRWMTPDLVESQLEALTGFVWTDGEGAPLLRMEADGLLTLVGGMDGTTVTTPATLPGTTIVLVQDRLAAAAAVWTVAAEADRSEGDRRLFVVVDPSKAAPAVNVRQQIAVLRARIHSRPETRDDERIDALVSLYDAGRELKGGASTGWTAVLAAMFRDPDFVTY